MEEKVNENYICKSCNEFRAIFGPNTCHHLICCEKCISNKEYLNIKKCPICEESMDHFALVVETTNFNPLQTFRRIPPTEHLKVTERFTRPDAETILYEFTVDDPTTYSEPWGGEIPFRPLNDRLYEYACHEGNYALSNILGGERYQERMRAEQNSGGR